MSRHTLWQTRMFSCVERQRLAHTVITSVSDRLSAKTRQWYYSDSDTRHSLNNIVYTVGHAPNVGIATT